VQSLLVTGGAGFIGSNFVRYMLDQHSHCTVTVLDKLTYAGNIDNLQDVAQNPRFHFVQGDICDAGVVNQAIKGCNMVVNFAAETHVDRSIVEPGGFVITDVYGTYTLLEAARQAEVERFIQISTDEVYGDACSPEGVSRPSLETDALMPRSPYAASKAGADRLAFSYWATYGLPVIITRCSNNYGPYQYPEKQLPLFIVSAIEGRSLPIYGDGSSTRDWLHVHDHCVALDFLLHAPGTMVHGEIFNIGSGEEYSILDNARAILQLLNLSSKLLCFVADRPGHVRRHAINTEKLRTKLGWRPKREFATGLHETIVWYQTQRDWLANIVARQDSFLHGALHLANDGAIP